MTRTRDLEILKNFFFQFVQLVRLKTSNFSPKKNLQEFISTRGSFYSNYATQIAFKKIINANVLKLVVIKQLRNV